MARAGRNERTARQIARELIRRTGASLGWDTIARKIDLATHKTAAEYIELMEDSFILKTLYQVDLNTGLPAARRMKKVYFLDSFIFWALRGWIESWPDCFDHARRALARRRNRLSGQIR